MTGIEILSTGSYLPPMTVTNDMMSQIVETDDEWISSRSGIRSRHFADGEDTSDMAVKSAREALESNNIDRSRIGVVIVATFTPDYMSPSIACIVQGKLGLPEDVIAFDMNGACSGFIYALNTARALLLTRPGKLALVVGSETISKVTDFAERSTCVLFGDGSGAVVVGSAENEYYFVSGAQGTTETIHCAGVRNLGNPFSENKATQPMHAVNMNGREVFRFAVESIQKCVKNLLAQANLKAEDISYFVCHQANKRILISASSKLGIPAEKFFMNLDHVGNTSAASIPIALDEMEKQGILKKGMKIICTGFGGGLVYGGLLFTV